MSAETERTPMTADEDSIPLDKSGAVALPTEEILTGRGFITGKSGSGKSNSASVIAEELLDRSLPLLIVDTDGEYWGLKETYELLHVGADEECDLQVGPEHAEKLASLALDDGVPIILDVSGYLDRDEAGALIREVARELFVKEKKRKQPFLLLVEEIHEYIPETGSLDETGEMLVKIGKRGRKHGLGIAGISQRPADVKKDFITQANWLLWHRLTWDNDMSVVRRVVDAETADAVQNLNDGECFLMADFHEKTIQRVQVRRKQTFDAGETPGLDDFERPDLKTVNEDLVGELEEISQREERRQDRISELEAEVERLEAEKEELQGELEDARDLTDMAQQFTEAMVEAGDSSAPSEKLDEIVEERNDLRRKLEQRDERIEELESRVSELEGYERRIEQLEALDIEEAEEAIVRLQEALNVDRDGEARKWQRKYEQEREKRKEAEQQTPDPVETDILEHPAVNREVRDIKATIDDLDEKALEMLEWYRHYGPGEAADAYFHAGGSRSSQRRYNYNKPLKQAGFIEKEERGIYRYAVEDLVRDRFGDNPQIDEEDIQAIIAEIEGELEAVVPA